MDRSLTGKKAVVVAFGLMLIASTATAQIVCELCQELYPGWDGFVVTSQESAADCRPAKGDPGAFRLPGVAGPWRRDARRVAAVVFGRLPAERADDPKAGAILEQMTTVLETDTDAIVLGRVGQTERRVCLVRAGPEEAWVLVRLDVADLSRPAPPSRGAGAGHVNDPAQPGERR